MTAHEIRRKQRTENRKHGGHGGRDGLCGGPNPPRGKPRGVIDSATGHVTDDFLSAYCDTAVAPQVARAIEDHLQTCERCRLVVNSYRAMSSAAAGVVGDAEKKWDATRFRQELLGRLAQEKAKAQARRSLRLTLRNAFALAGAVVVIVGAITLSNMRTAFRQELALESKLLVATHQAMRLGDLGTLANWQQYQ